MGSVDLIQKPGSRCQKSRKPMPGINKWKDDAEDLIVYKEENIKALNVIGRNVYDLEK